MSTETEFLPGMQLWIWEDEEKELLGPATSSGVRAAFYPDELWYGTEIELRSSGGQALGMAAATGPFMRPGDEGECYLSFQDGADVRVLQRPLTREQTLALFLRFGAGDTGFLDELPWEPPRG